MFGNFKIGILLLFTHILACITVGFLFRFWKSNSSTAVNLYKNPSKYKNISISKLGETIAQSISNSISTIMMIGGFVVIFSVIISIFNQTHLTNLVSTLIYPLLTFLHIPQSFACSLFTGFFEITNGISIISNIPMKNISINIILSAFLLGIGGLSVFLQVFSITSKTDLSIKPYIIGKILHGIIAALYTYLLINLEHIFIFY